jgi:hypothetical protein
MRAAGAIVLAVVVGATATAAQAERLSFRCVDSRTGTAWTLSVDTDARTVDRMPAEISASHIAWVVRPQNDRYELSRASGLLRVDPAAGHVRFERCRPAQGAHADGARP